MLMVSNRFYAIRALTAERFDELDALIKSRSSAPDKDEGVTLTVGRYGFVEDHQYLCPDDPTPEHLKRNIAILPHRVGTGPLVDTFFHHAAIMKHFLDRVRMDMEFPISLTRTPDGRLQLTFEPVVWTSGVEKFNATFDFETNTTSDVDRRPTPCDEPFLTMSIRALRRWQHDFLQNPEREYIKNEWRLLFRYMGVVELAAGLILHQSVLNTEAFLVLDPDHFELIGAAKEAPQHPLDACLQVQINNPNSKRSWIDLINDFRDGELDTLSEPLAKLIVERSSGQPIKIDTLRVFTWERFVS